MININPTNSRTDEKSKIKSKKKSAAVKNNKSFSTELQNSISFEFEGAIEELLTDLKDQEKQFLNNQTYYELNKYKALVQKILKIIADEGFKTKTIKPTRMHGLELKIIKDIDNKLLDIKNAITDSNKAFNIMKTIEEIRGLILDLVY